MNPEAPLPSESRVRRLRFEILLAALLLMLVYDPVMRLFVPAVHALAGKIVLGTVFAGLMISAVYAVSDRPRTRVIAILLGIPALVTECLDIGLVTSGSLLGGHCFTAVFLGYVILVLLQYVFRCDHVDTNTVFASLCVYLLLGVLWALIYSLIEHVAPGSFSYSMVAEEQLRFGAGQTMLAIYFSFTTMTTLGYGDVLPASSAARALTTLQALTGQLYLTVLVAWLVGLHIAHSRFGRYPPRNE